MTFAGELKKAAKDLTWLLEIELGCRIDDLTWTQVPATDAYWILAPEGKPSRVRSIDVASHVLTELEEKGTLAGCEGQAGSWFYEAATGRLYVRMTINASVSEAPDSGAYYMALHFWRLFCSGQRPAPNEIVFNGKWYDPRLEDGAIQDLSIEVSGFEEGGVRQTWSELRLMNGDGGLDRDIAENIWENKIFLIKVGAPGDAYASFITVARGRTGSVQWSDGEVVLSVEDPTKAED